ncbi:hypothetical protein RND81_10G241400 [Saponaria officinalis]|uniref:Uncharacterized protein n=1 Tax=Saponaria officinalis TaxID=3572 RepID=A0AAW1I805_SAPOF
MSNGLGWASTLLKKGIMGLNNDVIRANLKARDEAPQVAQFSLMRKYYEDYLPVIFAGSMRFDPYGPEFGLGKAIVARLGNPAWMNGLVMVEPGSEGGGSADLHVCLSSKVMDVLERDHEFMSCVS